MNQPDLKPWKCQRGHVLGQVKWKGHGESQLFVFREAVDLAAEHPAVEEVVAVMEGFVTATVTCSQCRAIRTWVPGEEAITHLIKSYQKNPFYKPE